MAYPAEKDSKYTYQDYVSIDDGMRYELIEGDLIMVPAPTTLHQRISRKLEFILEEYVTKNELGEVFDAPCDVYLDEETVLQPDILFISKERAEIVTKANIKGAPDLVIEIVSPSSAYYDLIKKKRIYARFGVKEYWVVDPEEATLEVHILENDVYVLDGSYKESDTFAAPMLTGLTINLAKIFK